MKNAINILLAAVVLIIFTSCNQIADRVFPSQTNTGYTNTSPGTESLEVKAIYPSGIGVSRTASIVVVFSKPVDTATVTANTVVILSGITLNAPTFSADNTIATFTYTGSLVNSTTYTVTVNTGITAADTSTLASAVSGAFTTVDSDSEDALAIPIVLSATRYPVPLSTVSVSTDYVEVTFSESVDNVTASTFTISGGAGSTVSAVTGSDNKTWRLYLNTLAYGITYNVTLYGTIYKLGYPAITIDTSNLTWSFTAEDDPNSTAIPDSIGSVWVSNVTATTATINWTTNRELSGSTVSYGTDSGVSSGPETEAGSNTVHSVVLTLPNDATRYYYRVTSGTATSSVGYFITAGDGTQNTALSTEANDKVDLNAVRNTDITGAYDGSSGVMWRNNTSGRIKASYFTAAGGNPWTADGADIDTNSRTNPKIFTDARGSFIATMTDGTNIYAKRFYNNGGTIAFTGYDWGGSAASTGMLIGTGSDPSVTVVWGLLADNNVDGGAVAATTTGTSVVLPAGNWFYDFDTDFTATLPAVSLNNVILNHSNGNLSLVTADGSQYRHALNQNSSNITSGTAYTIGNHLVTSSFQAQDHIMLSGTLSNSGSTVYTEHGYILPIAFLDAGDIVYNQTNSTGGRYLSNTLMNNIAAAQTGGANADYTNHLIDGGTDFTLPALGIDNVDCYARNVEASSPSVNRYSKITAIDVVKKTELTLNDDIFPDGNENYQIIRIQTLVAWGTATAGTSGNSLEDTSNHFNDGISAGNIVINTSNGMMTFVSSISGDTITLNDAIFTAASQSYQIWTGSILATGNANFLKNSHIVDGTIADNPLYSPDGFTNVSLTLTHAYNTTTMQYGAITGITNVDLTLDNDIITGSDKNYELLNLTASLLTGANTSVSPGELVASNRNFMSIAVNSYVLNTSDKTLTQVSGVVAHNLTLADAVMSFAVNDWFSLQTGSGTLASGSVTSASGSSNPITATGADFTTLGLNVNVNAYARNTATFQITLVTAVSANTFDVANPAVFITGDSYELFNITGAATTGQADSATSGELVENDQLLNSIATGSASYIINTTVSPNTASTISAVVAHTVTLNKDIFTATPRNFEIWSGGSQYTGGASALRTNYLINASFDFTSVGSLGIGDYVRNTTNNTFATILAPFPAAGGNDQLLLDTNIIQAENQGYQLIDKGTMLVSGTNDSSGSQIIDNGVYFAGISAGYLAVNTSVTPNLIARITGVTATVLTLDASIFTPTDNYEIWSGSLLASGFASDIKASHLIDGSKTGWNASLVNYLVQNTSTGAYATVVSALPTDLSLSADIFTAGLEGYAIYNDYCTTASHYSAGNALDDFYRINTEALEPVNASDTNNIIIYNRIITGTADALPTYPLLDNTSTFTTFVTAPLLNYYYVMNTVTFDSARPSALPTYDRVLRISNDIFTDSVTPDTYVILRFRYAVPDGAGGVITYGGDSSYSGNQFDDSTKDFDALGVSKGDLVYCVTTQQYAVVISAVNTQIVMNKQIFSATGQSYIVFHSNDRLTETGIHTAVAGPTATLNDPNAVFNNPLNSVEIGDVVRNQTTDAEALVTNVNSATQLTLSSAIMNIGDRYVVVQPRAFFAYENAGRIYADMLRLRDGSSTGGTISIYTGGIAGNVHTVGDGNGGAFVLYESAGVTIFGKRITADGAIAVGGVPALAGSINVAGQIIKVLPDGTGTAGSPGGIYILYENGGNVYIQRRNSALAVVWGPTSAASATDSVMTLDSTNRPMIAYMDSASGHIRISKYSVAGAPIYTNQNVNALTIGSYGTYYSNSDIRKSNISIVNNGTDGAVVSWIDTRFIDTVGFTIHALGITGTGTASASWNADSAGSDYNGVMIGIIGSVEQNDISFTSVNYNDGAGAWNPRLIWQDYRASRSDLYYQDFPY